MSNLNYSDFKEKPENCFLFHYNVTFQASLSSFISLTISFMAQLTKKKFELRTSILEENARSFLRLQKNQERRNEKFVSLWGQSFFELKFYERFYNKFSFLFIFTKG